ncbi:DNA-binding response regulator [Hoyosella rhizosphaerae]|uniref:DNA-binding response regulator n=1 Tax=Hoyosella rhizosphaerae TaxID=1755582 RepID=A0A916UH91_9ACTN|nr:DNA-binding response regulator [Hoyosella rhizosphaerae]
MSAERLAQLGDPSAVRLHPLVLVVDDNADGVQCLVDSIGGLPFDLHVCSEPAEALLIVGRVRPDVVVVAPVDGLIDSVAFASIVRQGDPDLPIFAAASPDDADFVARVSTIANIVIPRPYRVHELPSLVHSFVRHAMGDARQSPIDLGRLVVDGATPQMWLDGDCVRLPPREFLLLRFFAEHVGQVLSRSDLIHAVWGESTTNSNTLTVHIARLRRRLGDDEHNPQWLRAIRGMGYQFQVPAR